MKDPSKSGQAGALLQLEVTAAMERSGVAALEDFHFLDDYSLVKEVYKAMVLSGPRSTEPQADPQPSSESGPETLD